MARYVPRILPVDESLENIFSISSSAKMRSRLIDKYKINTITALAVPDTIVSKYSVITSKSPIQSKNLYPPSFRHTLGASMRASIEITELRAYMSPMNFSSTNDAMKLELI
jgi:hypothetical protein